MTTGVLEFDSVKELVGVLGRLGPEIRADLEPTMHDAGEILADRARSNASYSSRIPGAVYVRTPLSSIAAVVVGVDAGAAPEARVLELGNAGVGGPTFRHPVWGNDWRVVQDTQPFLMPALNETQVEIEALIAESVAATSRHLFATL